MSVHNHPPYRPMCNERDVAGQLRGACLNDDGTPRRPAMSHDHREAIAEVLAAHEPFGGGWFCTCIPEGEDGVREFLEPSWEAHLADALLGSDVLAQIRAEARAEALREAAERVEAHTLIGLTAGRAEAWDEGWLAAEESWGHEEPNEVNPYRAEGSA